VIYKTYGRFVLLKNLIVRKLIRSCGYALVYAAISIFSASCFAAIDGPISIEGGQLAGVTVDGVTSFKGVPYAAAPVGPLRWKAPQPPISWQGVHRADAYSSACIQNPVKPGAFYQIEFYPHPEPTSEDCLFLNVWTAAASAKERRPVMVWFHGGGFIEGSGSLASFDGAALARKGVVTVTVNYRLGVFGFFAHPELTKEAAYHSSGNYGLLDQRVALQWVKKNIAAFGGDPENVTIFGQSAGAVSVLAHAASPLDKNLFGRAVMQSGFFMIHGTLKDAEDAGTKFASQMGASTIADLRAKSSADVQNAANAMKDSKLSTNVSPFVPIIDGYFLTEDLASTFKQHKANRVAFMAGSTADEGTSLIPTTITAATYKNLAQKKFGDQTAQFLQWYPGETDAQAWRSEVDNLRDMMAATAMRLAEMQVDAGTKTYVYYFVEKSPGRDSEHYGAFHSSELVYVFDNLDSVGRPWAEADKKLADEMSSYWVNFAKTGNPNSAGLPTWSPWDEKTGFTLELGDPVQPLKGEDRKKLEELANGHFSFVF
jgi:para-nitrobenzyl esterase